MIAYTVTVEWPESTLKMAKSFYCIEEAMNFIKGDEIYETNVKYQIDKYVPTEDELKAYYINE